MSLKLENIIYTYMQGTPFEKYALKDVSLEVNEGEFIGIIGHTGCGKSTLVQHLNGLLKPDKGNVYVDGQLMNKASVKMMRKKVGLVFQYPEYQLFEETVYKDIAFGLKSEKLSADEESIRVNEAAKIVGLSEDILQKSVYDLSGGQKRRVAIAGVIVMKPKYLVLDEPAAGLDPVGRDEILNFAKKMQTEQKVSVILVSHSMDDIAKLADKVYVMNDGCVVLEGSPDEIFMKSDFLESIGLSVPQITSVINKIRTICPEIRSDIFTVSDAAEEIFKIAKERGVI